MKLRKLFAGVAAAATLFGGLALGATTANAADPTADITIKGDVAGRTFTAYPLGTYTNVVANADGTAKTVDFRQNTEWATPSIAEAAKIANDNADLPAEYAGNELAWVTTLNQTTDGANLRAFAQALAGAKTMPAPSATQKAADGADQVVLSGLAEGYYLVVDSNGAPILVGTKVTVNGAQTGTIGSTTDLGVANAKPTTVPTPEKTVDPTTVTVTDGTNSAKIGDTLKYTITGTVPTTTGYDAYTYDVVDTASEGLEIQQKTLKVTLDGTALVQDKDYTVTFDTTSKPGKTVTTVHFDNVAGKDGQKVVVTYDANITNALLNNVVSNSASVSHNGTSSGEGTPVTVHTYDFSFTKTDADGNALAGAGFVISKDGVYYVQDATTKAWSTTTEKTRATVFTSGADGKITVEGLSAGTYTVEETKVPGGYLQNTAAKFTVTLGGNAPVFAGNDAWGLAPKDSSADYKVKNVKSITQLPLTGAAGTALFTMVGLLLAAAAITVYGKSRSTKRALRA